jgi:hypothetical protein
MTGFQYQLVGSKHACMLAVSLHSLRKYHPTDPVQIVAGDAEAIECVQHIARDDPNVVLANWEAPKGGGKGLQHANKAKAFSLSPFVRTIFLDADTTVHSSLSTLTPDDGEVRLTCFADWRTTGGTMRKRLHAWLDVWPEEVIFQQQNALPAINTGVLSWHCDARGYLAKVRELVLANPIFMSDELAAQLAFRHYPHLLLGHRWNYSPKFSPEVGDGVSPAVIHYHGFQHARPDKSDGWKTWMPLYQECMDGNLCGVRRLGQDKHLQKLAKALD